MLEGEDLAQWEQSQSALVEMLPSLWSGLFKKLIEEENLS